MSKETKGYRARIDSVQQLRALAAICVVLVHAGSELGETLQGITPPLVPHDLVIGVDVFFAISGFIMYVTSSALEPGLRSALSFCRKRFIRIVPIYWFFTTLMLAATLLAAKHMTNPGMEVGHVLASYAFLPSEHPAAATLQPLLRVGWTLNYEMFFYVLFACSLLVPGPMRFRGILVSIFALGAIGVATDPGGLLGFYTDSVIISFAFGLVVGKLYANGILHGSGRGLLLGIMAIVAFVLLGPLRNIGPGDFGIRGMTLGVPAALLLASFVCLERIGGQVFPRLASALTTLGDSSYSLYLSHMFAIGVFKMAFSPFTLAEVLIALPLCVLFCIICGHLAYLLLEKRLVTVSDRVIPKVPALGS